MDYSDESVRKHTGRDWAQWVSALRKAGAGAWTRAEIVAYLSKRRRLKPWWCQVVATGYEVRVGRKLPGQNSRGEYGLTATRTLNVSAARAWKLLASVEGTAAWLQPLSEFQIKKGASFECEGGVFGVVRTMKAGERARLSWQETDWPKPTILQLHVIKRPGQKCIWVLNHEGLKSVKQREDLRAHWKRAIERFVVLLEKSI